MIKNMKPENKDTQTHIKELREQINSLNIDDSRPFTIYKIITYLCTIFFPLVPLAIYRLWCPKTEFSHREQMVWTAIILIIAAYAISMQL